MIEGIVLIAGGTLCGLLAGLLFGFTVAVIPGLRDLKADQHIVAMQRINVRIVNPIFLVSFLGPVFLLPLAALLFRDHRSFPAVALAAVLYVVGVIGVTAVGNIPLNNRLANVNVDRLTLTEAEEIRTGYHGPTAAWILLHHARTIAAILATVLAFVAVTYA